MRQTLLSLALSLCISSYADGVSISINANDGSIVKGELRTETISGHTTFLENVDLPCSIIKLIVLEEKDHAKLTLTNGDCFAFSPRIESLAVTTMFGGLNIPLNSIRAVNFSTTGSAEPYGLIFHCTFDSKEAIERPSVGPKGTFLSGDFLDGKYGKALALEPFRFGASFDLPEGFIEKSGCIEFWAKITKGSTSIGNGGDPRFFNISRLGTDDPHHTLWFDTEIVDNDGGGNSGVCFNTYYGHVASNFGFGHRLQYFDLLPEPWNDWHHYALSWDPAGIKLDDGTSVLAVLFIDGKPKSWQKLPVDPDTIPLAKIEKLVDIPKTLAFTWNHRHLMEHCTKSPFLMDEFKIWNCARTKFDISR